MRLIKFYILTYIGLIICIWQSADLSKLGDPYTKYDDSSFSVKKNYSKLNSYVTLKLIKFREWFDQSLSFKDLASRTMTFRTTGIYETMQL